MNDALSHLIDNGLMLLLGSTLILVLGTLAVLLQWSPVHRQRSGELTALAILTWIVLANVPLPRISYEQWALSPAGTAERTSAQRGQERAIEKQNDDPHPVATDESGGTAGKSAINPITVEPRVVPEPSVLAEQPVLQRLDPHASATEPAVGTRPLSVRGRIRRGIAASFLFGAGVCVLWLFFGRLLLWRMLRSAGPPETWLMELYESLPCHRRPTLLVTAMHGRAFSFGFIRPVIVLPKSCCDPSMTEQLRAVLLHELAHSDQRDARGRVLFNAAFPLLYFHPLYWVIRRRTFMAAELIADDRAASQTSRAAYTQELIALVRANGHIRLGHMGTIPVFESPTQFFRRMEMLMRRKSCLPYCCTPFRRAAYALVFMTVVVVLGSSFGIEPTQAQTESGTLKKPATKEPATLEPQQQKQVTEEKRRREPAASLSFNFQQAAWHSVLDWIAEETDLTLAVQEMPSGTLTYKDRRRYTPAEAVDRLNAFLMPREFILIRRDQQLVLWDLAEKLPANLVPRATPEELAVRGRQELLTVSFSPENVDPQVLAKDIETMLGKYGRVTYMKSTGKLIVTDIGSNLIQVKEMIDDAAKKEATNNSNGLGVPAVFPASRTESLDLIQLATAYTDAVGAMELAELKMKTKVSGTSDVSVLQAKIAARKVNLLKALVRQDIEATQTARAAAEKTLEQERSLVRKGYAVRTPSEARIRSLDGRIRALQLILEQ